MWFRTSQYYNTTFPALCKDYNSLPFPGTPIYCTFILGEQLLPKQLVRHTLYCTRNREPYIVLQREECSNEMMTGQRKPVGKTGGHQSNQSAQVKVSGKKQEAFCGCSSNTRAPISVGAWDTEITALYKDTPYSRISSIPEFRIGY